MTRSLTRLLPLVLAIGLTVAAGVVKLSWSAPTDLRATLARLDNVPMNVGDWVGTARPFDQKEVDSAGIKGGVLRTFRKASTGEDVTMMIVCGAPGPISVHTPDVCYGSAGFKMLTERMPKPIRPAARKPAADAKGTGAAADFWTLRMRKDAAAIPQDLEVTFGWSDNGTWQAPERDARLVYAGSPALFKLYVVRAVDPASPLAGPVPESDPSVDFLKALVPELNKALFPPRTKPA